MNKIRCYTVSYLSSSNHDLHHFIDYSILEETPDRYYVMNDNNKEIYVINKSVVSSKKNPLSLDITKPYYFHLLEEDTNIQEVHKYLEEAKLLVDSYSKLSSSIKEDIKEFESKLMKDKETLSKLASRASKVLGTITEVLGLVEKGGK